VIADHGRIDVLVNDAGVQGLFTVEATPAEKYDEIVGVNQRGTFLGRRAVLPHMIDAGRGVIVNITSTTGVSGMAATSAYTASRHAVIGLTRALALEVAPHGVRVVAVGPGAMRTPMLTAAFGEQTEAFAAQIPLGRLSDPTEVGIWSHS
jgi:3alpha(or 20beta)-hydroxysteroid dehydrogenase